MGGGSEKKRAGDEERGREVLLNTEQSSSQQSSLSVGRAVINEFQTTGQYSIGSPQTALRMHYAG